jgi:hypothetical protein
MNRFAPAAALLLLAACARSEEASLVQPDSNQGYNRVGAVGTPEQDDGEASIGEWRASLQEDRPALEFGPMGTEPLFSLLCTPALGVLLQRHGGAPTGPLPQMRVTIGGVDAELPVTVGGATIPMLRAELPAGSQAMQALASSGQPLTVRLGDAAPLVIPASPLVSDYVRSCARAQIAQPGNGAAPASAPPANSAAPATNNSAPAPAGDAAQPRR